MSSSQKNLSLLVLLVSLVGLAIALKGGLFRQKEAVVLLLSGFDSAKVEKIELSSPADNFTLQKAGENWQLLTAEEATSAARQKVDNFLAILGGLDTSSLVSINKDREDLYGFGADTVKTIKLKGGGEWEILVGQNTPDFSGNYVKTQSDNVYTSPSPLGSYFSPESYK